MKGILIVADTLRRDHLGAYGNEWIHTPNLDRLAARSAVFDQAYIGSFPTVPNRRDTFLGLGDKGVPFNRWRGVDPDEVTLSERLSAAEIPSMMVTDVANTVVQGLDLWKGFTAWTCNRGQEGDPCWLDADVPLQFPVPPDLIRYTARRWHQVLINRAHRKVETDWFAPGTYALAIEWLERNYKRDSFLLYIDTFDPHEPWDPPDWYERLYEPDYRGRRFEAPTYGLVDKLGLTAEEVHNIRARYAGEVTMVDAALGRLLEALERLGIDDEVLLIFTADHGTCFDYPGDNGMLCKANQLGDDGRVMAAGGPIVPPVHYYPHYTGVCRIPLLIRLPGNRRTRRVRAITQPWDLAPTVMDAFGLEVPEEMWGRSLLPLAGGEGRPHRQAAVLGNPAHAQVMTPQWMYATWRGHRDPVLYNLQTDPEQTTNLCVEHPDVVARLRSHLAAYLQRQGMGEMLAEYC